MKYKFIDTSIALAILLVVLVLTAQCLTNLDGFTLLLSKYSQMGVKLFFIVSAFTLCLSYKSRIHESKREFKFYYTSIFQFRANVLSGYFTLFFYFFLNSHLSTKIAYVS